MKGKKKNIIILFLKKEKGKRYRGNLLPPSNTTLVFENSSPYKFISLGHHSPWGERGGRECVNLSLGSVTDPTTKPLNIPIRRFSCKFLSLKPRDEAQLGAQEMLQPWTSCVSHHCLGLRCGYTRGKLSFFLSHGGFFSLAYDPLPRIIHRSHPVRFRVAVQH